MKQSEQRLVLTQAIEAKVHKMDMDGLLKLASVLKVSVPAEVKPSAGARRSAATVPGGPMDTVLSGKGIGTVIPAAEGARKLEQLVVDDETTDWADSELLGAGEIVQRLDIARGTLDNWRRANKVIAFRKGLRNYIYPFRQFERRSPLEGIDQLVPLFSSQEETWEWLVTPNPHTRGTAPVEALRDGAVETVVRAAQGALDYA